MSLDTINSAVSEDELLKIERAKNLLWSYLEKHNQDALIHMANTSALADNQLVIDRIELRGQIAIGFAYKR